jgi:hypothetical protein
MFLTSFEANFSNKPLLKLEPHLTARVGAKLNNGPELTNVGAIALGVQVYEVDTQISCHLAGTTTMVPQESQNLPKSVSIRQMFISDTECNVYQGVRWHLSFECDLPSKII